MRNLIGISFPRSAWQPGDADAAPGPGDVALALQALEVLEDGRGAGDLEGRAQLADGRAVASPEDEGLDGLEDLG